MSTQDMVERSVVAESLKAHRTRKRLSQRELGRRAGVGARNISYWEKARGEPTITAFIRLANALGVSLDKLSGKEL